MRCAIITLAAAAVLACLLASAAHAEGRITEIMFNPPGNDNNREFVEVLCDESMEGWLVADESSNDTLVLVKHFPSEYCLIVEEGYDYSEINASVYSVGSTIGNGLSNSHDTVSIYTTNQGHYELVDSVSYDGSMANGNGKSLHIEEGSVFEAEPTPGEADAGSDGGKDDAVVPEFSTLTAALVLLFSSAFFFMKREELET